MKFIRVRKGIPKVVKQYDGIYADNLNNIFEKETGLYTRLQEQVMAEVKKNNVLDTPEMHIQDQKHQINTELIEIIKFRKLRFINT